MGRAGSVRHGEARTLAVMALLGWAGCTSPLPAPSPGTPASKSASAGVALDAPVPPVAPTATTGAEPDITSYAVTLALDLVRRTVSGTATLAIVSSDRGSATLRLPQNGLHIDSVSARGSSVPFRVEAGTLSIDLPLAAGPEHAERQIEIAYRAAPERGLVFGHELVYTDFFTCHWMPCKEEPGDKASFRLELVVPESHRVVASGRLIESSPVAPHQTRFVWEEARPHSTYLFGFAVGVFSEVTQRSGSVTLRYLGTDLPANALQPRFGPTPDMLRFFESKSGVGLPRPDYVQILVPGSQAQEKSSFSLIGRDELDPILTDASEDWVIAHELAHQWWGNSITCKDWTHFWLNEGVTTFMVAAYKEQRWGAAAYERELGLFRERHQRAVEASFDVKLAFAGKYPSIQIKRAITYSKAALFLARLRQELGETSFWAGLGRFTRERAGQSVESRDFEQAFSTASGRDLSALFGQWVYD